MKRIKLLFLSFVFVGMANAANYYVDPAKADDSGNGTSWLTAKKTIAAAYTAAIAAGNWNNILVKGGIIDFTSTQTMGITANFYGSCAGNESSYTQRPLTDNDGNGIVEPWEFEFPTTLRFTSVNADALKLPSGSGIVFDGFTITHTGTSSSGTFKTLTLQTSTCQFKNNSIKDCDVTVKMTGSTFGILIKAVGNFTNNLIENNRVTVNATADGTCAPTLEVAAGARVAQCLIRNNRVIMDYSTGTTGNSNARGLIMLVTPSASAPYTSVSSCVIHNNEMAFTGNASNLTMSNGSTVALTNTASATDSVYNCTIANNKGTTVSTAFNHAGLKVFYTTATDATSTVHYIKNNVCWNNYKSDGTINNINKTNTEVYGSVTNNYTNGVGLSTAASGVISNNNNSIDAVTYTPNFISPTSIAGYLAYNTMKISNWRLGSGSYLIAKGVTTSTLKDKAGNSFAGTPSVGAYEDAKMSQSITFPVFATKTYGNADFIPGATSNTSSVVPITYTSSIGAVATIVAGQIHLTGAGQTTITASQASNTNYNAASNVQKVLTVSTATLTVSSGVAQNKVYDGTNAATLTGTLSGILNSDDVTLNGTGTFASVNVANGIEVTSTSTLAGAKAGSYTLTQPTGLTANITAATSSPVGDNLNNSGLTDQQLANTNLTINSGEFIVNATKTVRSLTVAPGAKLTFSSGALTTTNGIVLESDATGTATLIDSYSTPTISATVKQHVESGRNWYVSSPISTGNASTLSRGDSVVQYNEVLKKWEKVTGSLFAGRGYIQTAASGHGSSGTVNFSGLTNSGTIIAPTLTRTVGTSAGFNLVGNPYPSYLDWGEVATANPKVLPTAYYRTKKSTEDGGGYTFATVNVENPASPQVVTNDAATTITKFIPPMQSFWVRVAPEYSEVTDFTFTNTNREHFDAATPGNKLKAPKASTEPSLRIKLIADNIGDEALVYVNNNATNGFDRYDSPKMFATETTAPELYTKAGAEKLVINGLNAVSENQELTLGFNYTQVGNLKLKATEINNFDSNLRVYLRDKTDNKVVELLPETEYSFSTTTAVTNYESRFSLLFRAPGVTTEIDNLSKTITQVFVNAANQITILAPEKSNYAIYNAVGQLIEDGVINTERETRNTKHLVVGVYVVKVNNQSTRVIIK